MATTQKKIRISNIELLRIFSILLVVLHHMAIHTVWTSGKSGLFVISQYLFVLGGKVGVDLFVLISGYLMIMSSPKIKSLARTIAETIVFSLVMYGVVLFFHIENTNFDVFYLIKRTFPVIFNDYWFVTTFVLMYAALPIYLPFLNKLTRTSYKRFMTIAFVMIMIWPLIYVKPGMNFVYPVLFLFLFAVGGYIKKFDVKIKVSVGILKAITWALAAIVATLALKTLLAADHTSFFYRLGNMMGWTRMGWKENLFIWFDASPFPFLVALNIFLVVVSSKQFYSKTINFVGMHVFGAYLFQSAPIFTPWIYKTFIDVNRVNGALNRVLAQFVVAIVLVAIGVVMHIVLGKLMKMVSVWVEWVLHKFTGGPLEESVSE